MLTRCDLAASPLASLPTAVRDRLLTDAVYDAVPDRANVSWLADPPRWCLVLAGLLRICVTMPDGREVTLGYVTQGMMAGATGAIDAATAPDDSLLNPSLVRIQAMADTRLVWVRAATLRDLAQTELSVAWLLIEQLARSRRHLMRSFVGMAFGSVRQRVAKHLLELARGQNSTTGLLLPVTQRELADAVGSSREVVARALGELRVRGWVTTSSRGVRLLHPEGLAADAAEAFIL